MKKILYKSFTFIIFFLVIDFSLGTIIEKSFFQQKSGKFSRLTNSLSQDTSQIAIMGNSFANHSYIPSVFEKNSNFTVYNHGIDGQGILFQLAIQEIILKRYKPNLFVLNIDPNWMYVSEEYYDRLSDLNPYYWKYRDILKPILSLDHNFFELKLLLKSLRFNSTIVHVLKYFIVEQKDDKGYIAYYGKAKKRTKPHNDEQYKIKYNSLEIDQNFLQALNTFIINAKLNEVDLIFVISPQYFNDQELLFNKSFDLINSTASKNNVPLLNFMSSNSFPNEHSLFNDRSHLNNNGAEKFSKIIVNKLDSIYKINITNQP